MFSNDRNIETIGQLAEVVRHYIGLQTKYVKLDVIDKVVRLLTAVVMVVILSLLLLLTLIYLSFAAAYGLKQYMGEGSAFCVIAGVYALVFVLCILFRKRLLERPLVKLLVSILMQ